MNRPESSRPHSIPCVIIAGGQSRRFGVNKAFARLHGERLIDVLIRHLERQTSGPIAINAGPDLAFKEFRQEMLRDRVSGRLGPLAGLHAAMDWARSVGFDTVVTTPVDTPLLPQDFIEKLVRAGAPAVARHGGQVHAVHGIWPVSLTDRLADAIAAGMRATRDWAEACGATECDFPVRPGLDPFANANTEDDLLKLEQAQRDSPR